MKLTGVTVTFVSPIMGHNGLSGWTERVVARDTNSMNEAISYVAGVNAGLFHGSHIVNVTFNHDYTGMVTPQ